MCVFSKTCPYLTTGECWWMVDMVVGMNNGMYLVIMTCVKYVWREDVLLLCGF